MLTKNVTVLLLTSLLSSSAIAEPQSEAPPSYFENAKRFLSENSLILGTGTLLGGCYIYFRFIRNKVVKAPIFKSTSGASPAKMAARLRKLPRPDLKSSAILVSAPMAVLRRAPLSFEQRIYACWALAKHNIHEAFEQIKKMSPCEFGEAAQVSVFWEVLAHQEASVFIAGLDVERFALLLDGLKAINSNGDIENNLLNARLDILLRALENANPSNIEEAKSFLLKIQKLIEQKRKIVDLGFEFSRTNGFVMDDIAFRISVAMAPLQYSFEDSDEIVLTIKELRKSLI